MQAIHIVDAGQLKKDRGGFAPGDTVRVTRVPGGDFRFEKQAPTVSYGEHADDLLTTLRRAPDAEPSDQVMVLRNSPGLGVINGTTGTVTAIDRQRGELLVQTAEAEPRSVRLPASFWNAKGRRRVVLAYCRTIHKAQGATYMGASFTLAQSYRGGLVTQLERG